MRHYERISIENRSAFSLQQGQFGPQFQVDGSPPPTILLVRKLGCMWCKNVGTSFFCFVTIHVSDRQTDRKDLAIMCVALCAVAWHKRK